MEILEIIGFLIGLAVVVYFLFPQNREKPVVGGEEAQVQYWMNKYREAKEEK
jgi:hypothetical protein